MLNINFIADQIITLIHSPLVLLDAQGSPTYKGNAEIIYAKRQDFFVEILQKRAEFPILYTEDNVMMHCLIPMPEADGILVGPVCIGALNHQSRSLFQKAYRLSAEEARILTFCELEQFLAGITILYHACTGETITAQEILSKNYITEAFYHDLETQKHRITFEWQEEGWAHNPYMQEVREQESIRRGDLESLRKSMEETFEGRYGKVAKDELRQKKNLAIGVLTMASRSAIQGGVSPEKSFFLADTYIQKIEDMTNPSKVDALKRAAEFEYAQMVRQVHKVEKYHPTIERTKEYVLRHLHERIKVAEIAQTLGINADYLSRLFKETEEKTLTEYIIEEKISLSKDMLKYSEDSIRDISNYLAFCSQSHFGQSFYRYAGLTPAEYRKKYQT